MASVIEQILEAVKDDLEAAGIVGEAYRGRTEAWGEDELPGINIRRGTAETRTLANRLEQTTLEFEVEHLQADGVAWETAADAFHMTSNPVIANSARLKALARGLRCSGTEAIGASAEFSCGKLIARYQITFVTRPGDLTRAVN